MATLRTVTSASTTVDGPLFPISWTEVWTIGFSGITHLESLLNPAFRRAIDNTPEGGLMELTLTGWPTLPLIGETGATAAHHLNTSWQSGRIRYQTGPDTGQRIQLWPRADGGNGQLATWDATTRTVTLRWVKRQALFLYVLLILLGVLVVLGIVNAILAKRGKEITFHGVVPVATKVPTPGTPAAWWTNLSFLDKALIVGGGLGAVGFGVWVWGEERIARAGATRSNINIYTEGDTGAVGS